MPTNRSPLGMDRTLESLLRHGDIQVTDNGHLVCIDLVVRRSGVALYGTGSDLGDAIHDVFAELIDHVDAIDHLEDLGVEASDIGRLVQSAGEYDSDLELDPRFSVPPIDPAFITLPVIEPVAATAGQPDGPVLSDETNAAIDAAVDTAIATAIDTTGAGYVLALLIPVREGRA